MSEGNLDKYIEKSIKIAQMVNDIETSEKVFLFETYLSAVMTKLLMEGSSLNRECKELAAKLCVKNLHKLTENLQMSFKALGYEDICEVQMTSEVNKTEHQDAN